MSKPWKILIVGGGFGGLNAAQQLKSDRVDLTLIDRWNVLFRAQRMGTMGSWHEKH
jgi:NADH dehydrogenase FAD-containing subunit